MLIVDFVINSAGGSIGQQSLKFDLGFRAANSGVMASSTD